MDTEMKRDNKFHLKHHAVIFLHTLCIIIQKCIKTKLCHLFEIFSQTLIVSKFEY